MANYLPVLLVSVTAGMPDDASLKPLPRGQVDYLSHEWAEEDVWRSWRNMTKQKNEIANGVRLENASWRTWMKQRNNLKTVSPETLNWLKDSDVTWLYGPLHTAVDWEAKPSKQELDSSRTGRRNPSPIGGSANSLSSPSSSLALDRMREQHPGPPLRTSSHEGSAQGGSSAAMKPILKHRSIAEMLTGALPPAPYWAEPSGRRDEVVDGSDDVQGEDGDDPRESVHGRNGRPPLYHTRSDTNIIPRFGRNGSGKESNVSPPRVADATSSRDADASLSANLNEHQRSGASNNLLEMALHAAHHSSPYSQTDSGQSSPYKRDDVDSPMNDTSSSNSGVRFDEVDGALNDAQCATQQPQKKHISFNAIVEQCISIESGSVPATPSHLGHHWGSYEEESDLEYDPMDVDASSGKLDSETSAGPSKSLNGTDHGDIDEDMDDEDVVLEFKTSSRRGSSTSLQDYKYKTNSNSANTHDRSRRPQFRRSSTGSAKSDRSAELNYTRSSGRGSMNSSRSRSNGGGGDHVTIAPIAPTILKAGGTDGFEDGTLYMGGTALLDVSNTGVRVRDYGTGAGGYPNDGYGYGGYGFGEDVSAGRDDAYQHFERGTDAGELVFQSPNGNRYPWNEKDAIRFVMANEYGMPSPPGSPGLSTGCSSDPPLFVSQPSDQVQFIPLQSSSSPRSKDEAEQAEFEYFEDGRSPDPRLSRDATKNPSLGTSTTAAPSKIDQASQQFSSPTLSVGSRRIMRGDSGSSSGDSDERSPSPEILMKQNPRIASLKTDGFGRPSNSTVTQSDHSSGASPIPIVRPSLPSNADTESPCRASESPTLRTGFLSPPDLSPRGRWLSTPPESSGSATPSYFESGSRSTSESRSDSRGRSQTRNSSLTSSDTNEPERGRSRSRSNASGTNSPLRDTASPISRSPIAGGVGIGLGIGGTYVNHVGREIHDGKGVKLYRKTSEDNLGERYEGRSNYSIRGRGRDGKRVSESLSPPMAASLPADVNRRQFANSPPNGSRMSISPSSKKRSRGSRHGRHNSESPPPATNGDVRIPAPEKNTLTSHVSHGRLPSVAEDLDTSLYSTPPAIVASNETLRDTGARLGTEASRTTSQPGGKFSKNVSSAKSFIGSFWNGQ